MKTKKNIHIFEVCARRCDQCLFSPNKIVDDKRKKEVIKESLDANSYFTCHKSDGRSLCCKGFFDKYKDTSMVIILAQVLNLVRYEEI